MTEPHHVGVLGHSPEGAAMCWTEICRHSSAMGHRAHPDLSMDCISFEHVMPAWEAGDLSAVRDVLAVSAARLAHVGARFFVCPDNTAHLALESPGPPLPLPGLHIARVVAHRAKDCGYKRIGILGTRFTMAGSLYPRELGRLGIEAVVPEEADRTWVNRAIFEELVHGRITSGTTRAFHDLADRMSRDYGCDAVAAACTEIPFVLSTPSSPLPVLDSTRLLAQAAAEVAHGERRMPAWAGGELR